MKKLGDKIKGIFAKAGDEAAKVVDESSGGEGDTKDKADGEEPAWAKKLTSTMQKVADGLSQVASMSQPSKFSDEDKEDDKDDKKKKDDKSEDAEGEEKKDDAKDEEGGSPDESRLAKLEAKVDRLLAMMGEEGEESEDEDIVIDKEESEEEAEDDDFEESPAAKTGDQASRIEILAPGFKAKGKDAKRSALIEASKAKDTAAIIKKLNGGKEVDLKKASQKTIDHLFIGASEVVGLYRTKNFAKWKQVRDSQEDSGAEGSEMTPEKINEINEKYYAQKGVH